MIFDQVRLHNFRCYDEVELRPDPHFNVIQGLNGQGKTSILEAIGLLSFMRSFRNARNQEMLRFGEHEGLVSAILKHDDLTFQLAVKIIENRKQATINGKVCRYLSEYVGRVAAVSFSPNDLEIVRGGPENRRAWMDRLAQIHDPAHADAVARYQKILEHRNRILKAVADGRAEGLPDDFEVWTEELIEWGANIIHRRLHSVDKSGEKIGRYYAEISHQKSRITAGYISSIGAEVTGGQDPGISIEILRQALRKALDASLKKELILGTSLVGPHRDDLDFRMDENQIKAFGSQGEVRSLVLALRLTEVEACKSERALEPVLLIDDFSSELDAERRKFLLAYLAGSGSQVFLTTTEDLSLGPLRGTAAREYKVFWVKNGRITTDDNGSVEA